MKTRGLYRCSACRTQISDFAGTIFAVTKLKLRVWFRVLKSDIEIAPVHYRLPDRIRAHALICPNPFDAPLVVTQWRIPPL